MAKKSKAYWLYIVRCRDRSLYTGIAIDVDGRVARHNTGHGAKYTASRRPVRLVYKVKCGTRSAALRREYRIKQLTHHKKAALVRSFVGQRRRL